MSCQGMTKHWKPTGSAKDMDPCILCALTPHQPHIINFYHIDLNPHLPGLAAGI